MDQWDSLKAFNYCINCIFHPYFWSFAYKEQTNSRFKSISLPNKGLLTGNAAGPYQTDESAPCYTTEQMEQLTGTARCLCNYLSVCFMEITCHILTVSAKRRRKKTCDSIRGAALCFRWLSINRQTSDRAPVKPWQSLKPGYRCNFPRFIFIRKNCSEFGVARSYVYVSAKIWHMLTTTF